MIPSPNSSALRPQLSSKISRSSSTRITEPSKYRAFTTSFSLHFFSDDDTDDRTGTRVYSTLSADSAPPYACEMPSPVHQTFARYGSSQTWVLTGINNNDLAIATRHDFLRRIVKRHPIPKEKLANLEVGRMPHYHPPRSCLF